MSRIYPHSYAKTQKKEGGLDCLPTKSKFQSRDVPRSASVHIAAVGDSEPQRRQWPKSRRRVIWLDDCSTLLPAFEAQNAQLAAGGTQAVLRFCGNCNSDREIPMLTSAGMGGQVAGTTGQVHRNMQSITTMIQRLCNKMDSQRNRSKLHKFTLAYTMPVSHEGPLERESSRRYLPATLHSASPCRVTIALLRA
jgi:hypothetical protein